MPKSSFSRASFTRAARTWKSGYYSCSSSSLAGSCSVSGCCLWGTGVSILAAMLGSSVASLFTSVCAVPFFRSMLGSTVGFITQWIHAHLSVYGGFWIVSTYPCILQTPVRCWVLLRSTRNVGFYGRFSHASVFIAIPRSSWIHVLRLSRRIVDDISHVFYAKVTSDPDVGQWSFLSVHSCSPDEEVAATLVVDNGDWLWLICL